MTVVDVRMARKSSMPVMVEKPAGKQDAFRLFQIHRMRLSHMIP